MKFAIALLFGSQLFGAHFITFQAPACVGTFSIGLNSNGVVLGVCGGRGFIVTTISDGDTIRLGSFTRLPEGLIPTGINSQGAITGYYYTTCPPPITPPPGGCRQGFVRSRSGVVTKFSATSTAPGGYETIPAAINSGGQIVGVVESLAPQAFLRNADGSFAQLDALTSNAKGALATDINDLGEMTGAVIRFGNDFLNSFLRAANGTVTFTGPVGIADHAGISINNAGTVVGYANNPFLPPTPSQGYVQLRTGSIKLFPLPNHVDDPPFPKKAPVAARINKLGVAVIENVYYDGTPTMIDLGPCANVIATSINDSGWVTGNCIVPGQPTSGFLWRR
jgi:hypothetical protein